MSRKLAITFAAAAALMAIAAPAAHAISASPTDLNFGIQEPKTSSNAQSILVYACSRTSGCVSSSFSGGLFEGFTGDCPNTASLAFASSCSGSKQFTQTSNCPGTLSPGAACTIEVQFHPSKQGTFTATLFTGFDNFNPGGTVAGDKVFITGIGSEAAKVKKCKKKKGKAKKKCKRKANKA